MSGTATADLDDPTPAEPPPPVRRTGWLVAVAVALLLAVMAVPMVTSAVQQTPTIDEPVYVSAGLDHVREHDLRRNPEHPPLAKLLIGAGPALAGVRYDPAFTGTQQAVGGHLLYDSGNDPQTVMLAARLPVIVLTLLVGLVVFGFARDLAGPAGGLLALGLYAFTPDLIAHGALATLDVPAAGFVLTAVWMVWRARDRPARYLPLAGLALGAALATRMNTLSVVPVVLGLVILAVGRRWRAVAWAAGVGLIAVATVWLVYLAVDPRLRWTTPPGMTDVRGLRGLVIDVLPFPEPFRDGMRLQFGIDDGRTYWNFLYGRQYQGGKWYYLPAAMLVKSPVGMMLLWAAAVVALLRVRRLRPAAAYLLLPPLALLAGVAGSDRNYGTRYAVFVPMFLAVATAGLTLLRARRVRVATGVLAAYAVVSSAATFPYYLPYSNEVFGGPPRTHLWLDDSNVDWGQDLGRLADRLRERYPGEPVWLSYKGSGRPSAYGIRARDPRRVPAQEVCGLVVVSNSRLAQPGSALRAVLRTSTRIDTVGHSITIFRRTCA